MEPYTDAALLSLLDQLDQLGVEEPPDFDYEGAVTGFESFLSDFTREIGEPERVETRSHIQDASFHSQLLPRFPKNERHWLRFSRFGQLVSLYEDESVPAALLEQIVALVRRHGYRFVPYRLLARPYANADAFGGAAPDWYRRFFDWI